LWAKLNEDDKTLFPFDIKQMCWDKYLDTYHKGIMTYLLKEGPEKLPAAKKRLRGYLYLLLNIISKNIKTLKRKLKESVRLIAT